jgi:NDP-sugar pyrophosphorylase family protein
MFAKWEKDTKLVPPLHIEAGVVIGADYVIGPNVYIERECQIGDGATVRESVHLRGAILSAGVQVEGKVVS